MPHASRSQGPDPSLQLDSPREVEPPTPRPCVGTEMGIEPVTIRLQAIGDPKAAAKALVGVGHKSGQ